MVTYEDLPPAGTTRWVVRRKAAVVRAVRTGLLTLDEVLARYAMSGEEFARWEAQVDRYGIHGLSVTRINRYRERARREQEKRRRQRAREADTAELRV